MRARRWPKIQDLVPNYPAARYAVDAGGPIAKIHIIRIQGVQQETVKIKVEGLKRPQILLFFLHETPLKVTIIGKRLLDTTSSSIVRHYVYISTTQI